MMAFDEGVTCGELNLPSAAGAIFPAPSDDAPRPGSWKHLADAAMGRLKATMLAALHHAGAE